MLRRKWEYQVHSKPMFVGNYERKSPVMDCKDIEDWLKHMDSHGWEFQGFATKNWIGSEPFKQTWWIFRRPHPETPHE